MFSLEPLNKELPNFNWYPSLKCNFRCSYCYMLKELDNTKILDNNKLKDFYEFLKRQGNIKLTVLGGEPLLVPNIDNIIYDIQNLGNVKLGITTNGSLLHKFKFNNIILDVSIHLEYLTASYLQNLKIGVNNNLNNNLTISINVTPSSDKNIINNIIDELKDFKDLISFNQLTIDDKRDPIDFKEFNHTFDLNYDIPYKLNNKIIDYNKVIDIYNKFNNNFSGCFCDLDCYDIEYDYSIKRACINKIVGNIYDFDIHKMKPIVCDNKFCDICCFDNIKKTFFKKQHIEVLKEI